MNFIKIVCSFALWLIVACTPIRQRAHTATLANGNVVSELHRLSIAEFDRFATELHDAGLIGEDFNRAVAPGERELKERTEALAIASDKLYALARAIDSRNGDLKALAGDAADAIEHAVDVLQTGIVLAPIKIPSNTIAELNLLREIEGGKRDE